MKGPLPFDPWQAAPAELERYHVGREELLGQLDKSIRDFVQQGRVHPVYVYGPPGMGRSHLLALVRHHAEDELAGVGVGVLVEDLSVGRGVDWIMDQVDEVAGQAGPRVLFFEGLDRQLSAMDQVERRALRARLFREGAPTLLLGSGELLGEEFTGPDEAFFGALDPWPLGPLDQADSEALLERVGPSDWPPARIQTLGELCAGRPETLVRVGRLAQVHPHLDAAALLGHLMVELTPAYRAQHRGLHQLPQYLVEELASAPQALTPTELAHRLGRTPTTLSVTASRMVDQGVLSRLRLGGRAVPYALRDPLFRHWLAARGVAWEQTRIARVAAWTEYAKARSPIRGVRPEALCPRPWAVPSEHEGACRAVTRGLQGSTQAAAVALTWLAVAGVAPERLFQELLIQVEKAQQGMDEAGQQLALPGVARAGQGVGPEVVGTQLALLAVGWQAPQRLEQLLSVLPHPVYGFILEVLEELQGPPERLHQEVAWLVEELGHTP